MRFLRTTGPKIPTLYIYSGHQARVWATAAGSSLDLSLCSGWQGNDILLDSKDAGTKDWQW